MEIKEAVDTLRENLKADPDLYYVYQANIAMAVQVRAAQYKREQDKRHLSRNDIHVIANDAAKAFLDLFIQ